MASNINRADVLVDLKDIYGKSITDNVEIKIHNTQLMTEEQIFVVRFKGSPVRLVGVPAFPTGHAQMIITPTKYRFKQRSISVQSGETNKITEYFFVEPSKANPHPIEFTDLAAKTYGDELLRILEASGIDADAWNQLNKRNRATILNVCAKMSRETVKNGAKLITFVESIDQTWLDTKQSERIYARVKKELLPALRNYPQAFFSVSGGMHHFPPDGWVSVKSPNSFKTQRDSAGNIQLTFAKKDGEAFLADIDLDDQQGMEHVANVLKHEFSGKVNDPYDIHQILWFFQQLDVEYRLIPQTSGINETAHIEFISKEKSIGDEESTGDEESATDEESPNELIEIAARALTDTPSEKVDLLNFVDFADALFAFIKSERTEKPLTIGIDAAWGVGKTQLMHMVRQRLIAPAGSNLGKKAKVRSSFPTVWFDAWKYDGEDALWAALVLQILKQISSESTSWQRGKLALNLKWKRFDKESFLSAAGIGLAHFGIIFVVGTLLITAAMLLPHSPVPKSLTISTEIAGILAFAALAFRTGKNIYQQLIEPLEKKISKYVRDPNYKARVGFLGEFEEDFERVVDLVTENGKWPLVVFIDDLDRCAPSKAVEVIEALNILLDAKYCVFVIGMDAKTVAQSIEAKYRDLTVNYSDDPGGLTLGERFLEKIVQLNFRIPRAYEQQVESFIDKNLRALEPQVKAVEVPLEPAEAKLRLAEQVIQAEQRGGKDLSAAAVSVAEEPKLTSVGITQGDVEQARNEIRRKAFEEDKKVQQAVSEAAPYLGFNPRKIKRFINSFRLQALIAQKRNLIGKDELSISLLAKAVTILARWPDAVTAGTSDGDFFRRLKETYKLQESLRQQQSLSKQDTAKREIDQARLNILSADLRIKRLVDATDLSKLLATIDNDDFESLSRCFQLRPASN